MSPNVVAGFSPRQPAFHAKFTPKTRAKARDYSPRLHAGTGIRKSGRFLQISANVFTDGGVARRKSPIDEPLLQRVVQLLEARRCVCQYQCPVMRAIERIGQLIILDIGANTPIGAFAEAHLVGSDHLPLAQAHHLIVEQGENPVDMLEPFTLWLGFVIGHTAAVTHQNRLVTLRSI